MDDDDEPGRDVFVSINHLECRKCGQLTAIVQLETWLMLRPAA